MRVFRTAAGGPVPAFKLVGDTSRLSLINDVAGTIQLDTDDYGHLRFDTAATDLLAEGSMTYDVATPGATPHLFKVAGADVVGVTASGLDLLGGDAQSYLRPLELRVGSTTDAGPTGQPFHRLLVEGGDPGQQGNLNFAEVKAGQSSNVAWVSSLRLVSSHASSQYVDLRAQYSTLMGGSAQLALATTSLAFVPHQLILSLTTDADLYTTAPLSVRAGTAIDLQVSLVSYLKLTSSEIQVAYPITGTDVTVRSTDYSAADSVGLVVDTSTSWDYLTGARVLSLRNNGVEVFRVRVDGQVWTAAGGFYSSYVDADATLFAGLLSLTHSAGKSFQIQNTTEGYTVSGTDLRLHGNDVNGASAVSVVIDTPENYTTTGAKILSIRNGTVEKAYFDKDGNLSVPSLSVNSIPVSTSGLGVAWPFIPTVSGAGVMEIGRYLDIHATSADGLDYHSRFDFADPLGAYLNNTLQVNALKTDTVQSRTATTLSLLGTMVDGAAALGVKLGSAELLSTSGSKLASLYNYTTEKAYFSKDGNLNILGTAANENAVSIPQGTRFAWASGNNYAYSNGAGIYFGAAIYVNNAVTANGSQQVGLVGLPNDSASAVAVALRAYQPLVTAGAKIVSFFNSVTSNGNYQERAFIDKDGKAQFNGGVVLGTANSNNLYNDATYALRTAGAVRFDGGLNATGVSSNGYSSTNIGGSGLTFQGGAVDTASPPVAFKFYNYSALTQQTGRSFSIYNDNNVTERLYISPAGFVVAPDGRVDRSDGASAGVNRTNLCLESQTFNAATWVKSFANGAAQPTVTANSTAAPDGSSTADTLTFGAVGAGQYAAVGQGIALSGSTVYTFSVWLKAAVAGQIYLYVYSGSTFYAQLLIDVPTDWRRFQVTFTTAGAATYSVYIGCDTVTSGTTMTSKSAITLYGWGAQVETGIRPTSYIVTTGTSASAISHNALAVTTLTQMTAATGRLLSIQNVDIEKFGVDMNGAIYTNGISNSAGYIASNAGFIAGFSYPITLQGRVADGASAVNAVIDTFGNAYTTAGAKLLSIRNNAVEKVAIDKDGNIACGVVTIYGSTSANIQTGGGYPIKLVNNTPDGASAVGTIIDTTATFSTAGAKLVSFRNATTEKSYIDYDGNAWFANTVTAAARVIVGGSGVQGGTNATLPLKGRIPDSATAIGIKIGNINALTTSGAKIVSFYSDDITTEKAYITLEGSYVLTTGLWDDVQCSVNEAGGASALTAEVYRDTLFQAKFMRHDQDDTIYLTWQMPHSWDPSTSVKPHIHWIPMVNPGATQVVRFTGKYAWIQVGTALPADASWTSFTVDTNVGTTDEFKEKVTGLATVSPPASPKESNILVMWLRRPGSSDANDTYTTSKASGTAQANVMIVSIDAHYQKVKLGSVAEIP